MNIPTLKSFWLSIGLALCLHAALFMVWVPSKNKSYTDKTRTYQVAINLVEKKPVQPKLTEPEAVKKTSTTSNNKPLNQKTNAPESTTPVARKTTAENKQQAQKAVNSNSQDNHKLYRLLYTAINQQKYYPTSALRMKQQGTVRVSFKLFKNGRLEEIAVSQSSGHNSLDHAALLAVKRIQPFRPAAEFLAAAKDFQLDIIFQL